MRIHLSVVKMQRCWC